MSTKHDSVLNEETILRVGNYDALTGLPNLAYFFKICEDAKVRMFGEKKQGCLLYIDLNGMKYYNDRNGFAQGDAMLKRVAELLRRTFDHLHCCHVGADRFVVGTFEDGLEQRLRNIFYEFEQKEPLLTMRVGIYSTGVEDVPITTAYDRAKLACDSIHKSDQSRWCFYTLEMSEKERRRRYIETNIGRAISEGWIEVYYQAIFRAVNEKVCDEEALVRWFDPEMGMISPAEFIPVLEASGQIYKLDLYVVDQILNKIRMEEELGMRIVPHSVNLSRLDFEACDIVEEVRKRVDEAGIGRDMLTIEITESQMGCNFDYLKSQIERFKELGFAVWMDDFGSGYSSLDVLQSVHFDLIKFDMSFTRKLDESENARIVLSELIRMAIALGFDTICEGVETEEQVNFLKEIGCSKLQGYYYSRPVSFSKLRKDYNEVLHNRYENPGTTPYYETIGRMNLYDLEMITSRSENSFLNAFNTIPIGIIEICGESAWIMRNNPSFRSFLRQYFKMDISDARNIYTRFKSIFTQNISLKCVGIGGSTFFNWKSPEGPVVHFFIQRIGENPKNGGFAIAVAVLSITDPDEDIAYADIARALSADYYNIYVVDLDTDSFITYASQTNEQEPVVECRGEHYFGTLKEAAMTRIHEDDREWFMEKFNKENIVKELDEHGVYIVNCRMIDSESPISVRMKVTRMHGTNRIIIGINHVT